VAFGERKNRRLTLTLLQSTSSDCSRRGLKGCRPSMRKSAWS
jgi:hypothetical protein